MKRQRGTAVAGSKGMTGPIVDQVEALEVGLSGDMGAAVDTEVGADTGTVCDEPPPGQPA